MDTPDPYADCRLAIAVHEQLSNDLLKMVGFTFWEMNIWAGVDPVTAFAAMTLQADRAIDNALDHPQFAGLNRAEVKRQMWQPSFLQWIAGNLGAV